MTGLLHNMKKKITFHSVLVLLFLVRAMQSCRSEGMQNFNLELSTSMNTPMNKVLKRHFEPPGMHVDSKIYSLCLKNALIPLLKHCLSLDEGVETFDSFERLKIGIDLTVCDFIAIEKHSFDPYNKMDTIIREILSINTNVQLFLANPHKPTDYLISQYEEMLKLIKRDNKIWTTFSIKNEKMQTICKELEQPLQRTKLEHMAKKYQSDIEQIISLNSKALIEKVEILEKNIDRKINFMQQEQEQRIVKSEAKLKNHLKKAWLKAETVNSRLSRKLLQQEIQFKEFKQNVFFINIQTLPKHLVNVFTTVKPLLAYKYAVLVVFLMCWTYRFEMFKLIIIGYLLTFEVLKLVSDSMVTKCLITVAAVATWKLNLGAIFLRYRYSITKCFLLFTGLAGFFLNLLEFGSSDWKKSLIFIFSSYLILHRAKPWQNLYKIAIVTLLIITVTTVNIGLSIYDFN